MHSSEENEQLESTNVGGFNIVTVEVDRVQTVTLFQANNFNDEKKIRYSEVRKGFATQEAQKDSRFKVSDLARRSLSIEQEEEERIQKEIDRRLHIELEKLKADTYQKAYDDGFSAGKEEGTKAVFSHAQPMLEHFKQLISEFEQMRTEIFKTNEQFIVQLIYQLARSVVLREIKDDKEYTKRLALHLIDRVGTKENIKIFLGQKEYSAAEQLKADLAQTLGELKNVSIELDPEGSELGCRIETEFGEVDARIATQIQNMADGFGAESSAAVQSAQNTKVSQDPPATGSSG